MWSLQSLYVSNGYSYNNQINFTFISENLQKLQLFQHPYSFIVLEPSTSISQCKAMSLYSLSLTHPSPLSLTYPFLFIRYAATFAFAQKSPQSQVYADVRHFFLSAILRNRLLEGLYEMEMANYEKEIF